MLWPMRTVTVAGLVSVTALGIREGLPQAGVAVLLLVDAALLLECALVGPPQWRTRLWATSRACHYIKIGGS